MPGPKAPEEAPEATDPADLPYEPSPELTDGEGSGAIRRARGSPALKIAVAAAAVLLVAAAVLAYRAHHRHKVVAAALAQADALLRLDTASGYRRAASLLEPIAQLDPIQGASVRAFALAMLFADYREPGVDAQIDELLLAPGRAEVVPAYAQLATAAVALGRKEAGTATTAVTRAGDGPWPSVIVARIALLAGNEQAALAPAAAAAESAFPAGLALHGDVLRRVRGDLPAAQAAYEAALAASPLHPRATYGLAKLALSDRVPAAEAEDALRRLAGDRAGTPAPERARAAHYLAALRLRAGDRSGAAAALSRARLDRPARAWANRAAEILADNRGPYRAVSGAPPVLQSASDDDPGELSPAPPPPPPPPPKIGVKRPAVKNASSASKAAAKKRTAAHASSKKAGAKSGATHAAVKSTHRKTR